MLLTLFAFIVGFVILIGGARWLVDGASALAKHLRIAPLIIGLTVVAFGTSLPELVINLIANLSGVVDIGVGNILGSNIANTLLILGVAAMIYPLTVHRTVVWREVFFSMVASGLLVILISDVVLNNSAENSISRIDGR